MRTFDRQFFSAIVFYEIFCTDFSAIFCAISFIRYMKTMYIKIYNISILLLNGKRSQVGLRCNVIQAFFFTSIKDIINKNKLKINSSMYKQRKRF